MVSWFNSTDGLDKIYGRFYYPADFDANKTYPTVIMAHGSNITSDIYDTYYAPALAEAGYICFSYDVRGVTADASFGGRAGSYSTNNAKRIPDLDTYAADAGAALDFVKSKDYVDADNLYMWGQSMGALTTQIITSRRGDELRGTILLYGAVSETNAQGFSTDEIDMMKVLNSLKDAFAGEALFILGADDPLFGYEVSVENMDYYNNSSFEYISGASHGFGYMADRATIIATETVLDYLARTVTGQTLVPEDFGMQFADQFNQAPDKGNSALKRSDHEHNSEELARRGFVLPRFIGSSV